MAVTDGETPRLARYAGRTAVVTGAAQGLGRAYAQGFATEGAYVVCVDLQADGLAETVRIIREDGGEAEAQVLDVADEPAVLAFADRLLGRRPEIGVLLNNAAIAYGLVTDRQALGDLDQAQWMRFLAVNTVAPVILGKALRPGLSAARGCIINQSSMASTDPMTAYGVTKSALNAMTRMMAGLYAKDGVRVNAIAPGLFPAEALQAGLSQDHAHLVRQNQLLDRTGEASDLVGLALFLGSEAARFMTSEVIFCDGGSHRRSWRY